MLSFWSELLVAGFLLLGSFFALVGSIGLLRLKTFHMRLHGPAKATTLGVGAVLIASMLFFSLLNNTLHLHELLVTLFLVISAPVSAYMLSRAAEQEKVEK